MSKIADMITALDQEKRTLRQQLAEVTRQRDALAELLKGAERVLERTANDTLAGRNMAEDIGAALAQLNEEEGK
jgi:seryl-tRNA synthetase